MKSESEILNFGLAMMMKSDLDFFFENPSMQEEGGFCDWQVWQKSCLLRSKSDDQKMEGWKKNLNHF